MGLFFIETVNYITERSNTKKLSAVHRIIIYVTTTLLFLWFIIPQVIGLYNEFARAFPSLGLGNPYDHGVEKMTPPEIEFFSHFSGILWVVTVFYGVVYFSTRLTKYHNHQKIYNEKDMRFAFIMPSMLTIFTLIVFWFAIPRFINLFREISYGCPLPGVTVYYISLTKFLCRYWYTGFIPIIVLVLFETLVKINRELKTLIYSFIGFLYILLILTACIAFLMPFISM
jgi:hypothetical protein